MKALIYLMFKNGKTDSFYLNLEENETLEKISACMRRSICDKLLVTYFDTEKACVTINFSEVQYVRVSEVKERE
jgi:hypothetical protein